MTIGIEWKRRCLERRRQRPEEVVEGGWNMLQFETVFRTNAVGWNSSRCCGAIASMALRVCIIPHIRDASAQPFPLPWAWVPGKSATCLTLCPRVCADTSKLAPDHRLICTWHKTLLFLKKPVSFLFAWNENNSLYFQWILPRSLQLLLCKHFTQLFRFPPEC